MHWKAKRRKQKESASLQNIDRVLATYSGDGFYFEGIEYWIFSTPGLITIWMRNCIQRAKIYTKKPRV